MLRIISLSFVVVALVGAVVPWSSGASLGPVDYWHGYGHGPLGVAAIAALAMVLLTLPRCRRAR